jgi:hypothetical protein
MKPPAADDGVDYLKQSTERVCKTELCSFAFHFNSNLHLIVLGINLSDCLLLCVFISLLSSELLVKSAQRKKIFS